MTQYEELKEIRKSEEYATLPEVAQLHRPPALFYPTGFPRFDDAIDGGVRVGELVVISGQTGEGKTTFAQNLTKNFDDKGIGTLWFSYEMNPWYLQEKFVIMGRPNIGTIVPKDIVAYQMDFIEKGVHDAAVAYGVRAVFIDHLHYIVPIYSDSKNTSFLVGNIVRGLKKLAEKEKVAIFLIAHTKKIYEGEELNLSSIRDSSLVAQESDYVFLVQRLKEDKKKLAQQSGSLYTDQSKVVLAKNRRTGKQVFQTFLLTHGVFGDIPQQDGYDEVPGL